MYKRIQGERVGKDAVKVGQEKYVYDPLVVENFLPNYKELFIS